MNATSAGGKVKNRNNSSRPISGNLRSAFRSSSVNTGTTNQHLPPEPADPQRRSLLRHIRPIFPEYYGDPYQVGQENQLDSLGIMINVIVLWQTVYIQAALDHLAAKGYPIDPADVARLTPLGHPTINLDGRYRTTNRPPATGLRPLRIN